MADTRGLRDFEFQLNPLEVGLIVGALMAEQRRPEVSRALNRLVQQAHAHFYPRAAEDRS